MDSINWAAMFVATGFGTMLALIFFGIGTWMDRRRIARWDAELNGEDAPRDIVIPTQRTSEENDADGA